MATYFRDVLGFTWEFGDETYAVVWRDNSAVHLTKGDSNPTGVHLFQWIRNVDAYHDEVLARGADVSSRPVDQAYGIREFAVRAAGIVTIVFGQDVE